MPRTTDLHDYNAHYADFVVPARSESTRSIPVRYREVCTRYFRVARKRNDLETAGWPPRR